MSADGNEKTVFGASIVPTLAKESSLDTLTPFTSNAVSELDTSAEKEFKPTSSDALSPFYSHPTTRTSLEQAKYESRVNIATYPNSQDLEVGLEVNQAKGGHGVPTTKGDDRIWPCPRKIRERHLARKQRRGCDPLRSFSKKQRILIQSIIALLLIASITGLGIGISKAVGGGVFRTSNNSNAPV